MDQTALWGEAVVQERAERGEWEVLGEDGDFVLLPYHDTFTPEEFERIRLGLIPNSSDDKWFCFFESQVLFLCRSWTGHLIFKVHFDIGQEPVAVSSALVLDDTAVFRRFDDKRTAENLRFTIRALILKQDLPFPVR